MQSYKSRHTRTEIVFLVFLVLGLSLIIVLKVGLVSQSAYSATCVSNAEQINQAVQMYLVASPQPTQVTRADLSGGGIVKLTEPWPTNTNYSILIAGDANNFVGMLSNDSPPVRIAMNDVIVRAGTSLYDVTKVPSGCSSH